MPTVRGLIQDIQHNGLLRTNPLTTLTGCTIGIDAIAYFEPLYLPPTTYDVLNAIDIIGLDKVVSKQLQYFQTNQITPIFVFPGISPNDRVYTLHQQELLLQQQQLELAAQEQQKQQQQQPPSPTTTSSNTTDFDAGMGFYRPVTKNKRNKKILQQQHFFDESTSSQSQSTSLSTSSTTHQLQTPQPTPVSATSTISNPLDEVLWSFDETSLLYRQKGWDHIDRHNITTAQQYFFELSTTFSFPYRKALLQILQKYQLNNEYGEISIIQAPYTVSAQLAWLQRAPHHYVHAVIGQSDILLLGVERFIQAINFDTNVFNYILLHEVLNKYSLSLQQLISVSLIAGYSFALTHPLSLNDCKTPSTFGFTHALTRFRTVGQGSLQTLLEWWVQQPPGPSTSSALSQSNQMTNSSTHKNDHDSLNIPNTLSLSDQIATVTNINKVLLQLQGSMVFGDGGKLVLLFSQPCELIDMTRLSIYGKCAQRLFKEQIKQQQQIALQTGTQLLKGKQLHSILQPTIVTLEQIITQYTNDHIPLPQSIIQLQQQQQQQEQQEQEQKVQLLQTTEAFNRPHVPLPTPILQLLLSTTIQPASLSSLFTGHLLDVTVHNPSNELDQILDWCNLSLRGPAIWSILYSLYQNSTSSTSPTTSTPSTQDSTQTTTPSPSTPTVHPAYQSLYKSIRSTTITHGFHSHEQSASPFLLNSRFNDKRKGLWPRDVISYCRRGGSDRDISYGIDKIKQFEEVDKIMSFEQIQYFQTLLSQMSYNPENGDINPITHYLSLLLSIFKLNPHSDPTIILSKKQKKAAQAAASTTTTDTTSTTITIDPNATLLTPNEQFIGLGMIYILFFIGLITPKATLTRFGYAIMTFLQTIQTQFKTKELNAQLYDSMLFMYVMTFSDVLTQKVCTIESSELTSPTTFASGKSDTNNSQRFNRIVLRLLSILPYELQQPIINNDELSTQLLGLIPLTSTENTFAENCLNTPIGTTATTSSNQNNQTKPKTKNNQRFNNTIRTNRNRVVPQQLLTILNRELACYSSIVLSLIQSFQYSLDLILAGLSLYNLYPTMNPSQLPSLIPLQNYQPSPILACLLRQRSILLAPKSQSTEKPLLPAGTTIISPTLQSTIVGFWGALVQATGGLGVTTDDINNALKNIV